MQPPDHDPAGRLGLNGPEVIEQDAGIAELDSRDRALIWSHHGGEQRVATGLADELVEDDTYRPARRGPGGVPAGTKPDGTCRSAQVELFAARLAAIDPDGALDPAALLGLWSSGGSTGEEHSA